MGKYSRKYLSDEEISFIDANWDSMTVAQATTYVNNKLDAATTVAAMKEAVRDILIKMIPYVLE
jgi:hypothetical protein